MLVQSLSEEGLPEMELMAWERQFLMESQMSLSSLNYFPFYSRDGLVELIFIPFYNC